MIIVSVTHFLGFKLTHIIHSDGHVSLYLNQPKFIDHILKEFHPDDPNIDIFLTQYRSVYPVDSIISESYDVAVQFKYTKLIKFVIGSLNWLAISIRPDI